MKRIILTITICLLTFVAADTAQAQACRNAQGCRVGKVESDGTVRDGKGCRVGKGEISDKKIIGAAYFFFNNARPQSNPTQSRNGLRVILQIFSLLR